jgi:hypothetical protein
MWGEKTAVCETLVSDWLDRVEDWIATRSADARAADVAAT